MDARFIFKVLDLPPTGLFGRGGGARTDLDHSTGITLHLQAELSCRLLQQLLLVEQFVLLVHFKRELATGRVDRHRARTSGTEHQSGVESQSLKSHHRVLEHTLC